MSPVRPEGEAQSVPVLVPKSRSLAQLPETVAVLPLSRHEQLVPVADQLAATLRPLWMIDVDSAGSIGKRYRRQDEVGTPFCVTVDYQTKEDGTVTVRFRDSMEQIRVKREDLESTLKQAIKDYKRA